MKKSGMRHKRQRSCGKQRYRDAQSAKHALRSLSDSARDRVPCRHYFCEQCKGYHLTSRP